MRGTPDNATVRIRWWPLLQAARSHQSNFATLRAPQVAKLLPSYCKVSLRGLGGIRVSLRRHARTKQDHYQMVTKLRARDRSDEGHGICNARTSCVLDPSPPAPLPGMKPASNVN